MKRTTSIIKFAAQLDEQTTKHRKTFPNLRVYQISAFETRRQIEIIFQDVRGKKTNYWKQTLSAEGEWSDLTSHGPIIL
jgi:hypothetical protein